MRSFTKGPLHGSLPGKGGDMNWVLAGGGGGLKTEDVLWFKTNFFEVKNNVLISKKY